MGKTLTQHAPSWVWGHGFAAGAILSVPARSAEWAGGGTHTLCVLHGWELEIPTGVMVTP